MDRAVEALLDDGCCRLGPNRDVNEVAAIVLGGTRNGCVILGGGSPKNFYLQGQPTLWEIYGIPKGGTDYFVQIKHRLDDTSQLIYLPELSQDTNYIQTSFEIKYRTQGRQIYRAVYRMKNGI